MFRRSIVFIVALPLLAAGTLAQTTRHGAAPKGLIGYLRKEQYKDKYGCTYSNKNDRNRVICFGEDLGGAAEVLMNIDGNDEQLKYVGSFPRRKNRMRIGEREVLDYAAPGVTVRVVRFVGKEVGSGSNYSGTITVRKGKRTQTVQFSGWCGA